MFARKISHDSRIMVSWRQKEAKRRKGVMNAGVKACNECNGMKGMVWVRVRGKEENNNIVMMQVRLCSAGKV